MNKLIQKAQHLPVNEATSVISVAPVIVPSPGRVVALEVRISAPITGENLPIIILSHGHGPSLYIPSLNGYGPLANFWAAHGFVVIQPTHLNAKIYGLGPEILRGQMLWRSRVEDMSRIVDRLELIEASVPGLSGRVDRTKIAAAGHSMGGQTVGMLLGARLNDPLDKDATDVNLMDKRFKAGVLLAAPGKGGDDLSEFTAKNYSFLNPDFSYMATPTLVVAGENDVAAHLTTRSADWYADPYKLSPGNKSLLTVFGAKHGLGGIAGYDAAETTDEDPDRLAVVQRLTWAYLHSAFYPDEHMWNAACEALAKSVEPLARIESK